MASLKELRGRITSVKSTRRITSAMKMVAAAKLRRAQEQAEAARPYAEKMERMLGSLASGPKSDASNPLLVGTGKDDVHLLVLITSDRGLCGGFNGTLLRDVRKRIMSLQGAGKTVKLIAVGRKGVAAVRREFRSLLVEGFEELSKPAPHYDGAQQVSDKILAMFEGGEFDVCTIIYNRFVSAISQEVTPLKLIPFSADTSEDEGAEEGAVLTSGGAVYEFEPDEEGILNSLLPKNLSVQVYRALLESFASEQGARMTAMDNATRNAGDMINRLTITYNRSRQAQITKELIEIISGAEAL